MTNLPYVLFDGLQIVHKLKGPSADITDLQISLVQIFFSETRHGSFDLLTVTFQGQIFLDK